MKFLIEEKNLIKFNQLLRDIVGKLTYKTMNAKLHTGGSEVHYLSVNENLTKSPCRQSRGTPSYDKKEKGTTKFLLILIMINY